MVKLTAFCSLCINFWFEFKNESTASVLPNSGPGDRCSIVNHLPVKILSSELIYCLLALKFMVGSF